ncbi:MAG: dihydropteroate synthase [Solirubrobacterales bacterium]|nr:dihydropteroate synthase [Solirubrobacterales bacterium]
MTVLMGIVNVTPDSFSDGGQFLDPEAAIAHGEELAAAGAAVLDVGGESTRPGAAEVSAEEEIERVVPVVTALARAGHRVSVDTSKAAVAERAIQAGAEIVNDVTALGDPDMAALCAEARCGLVLMHMKGTPRTMQDDPVYDDVVADVRAFLTDRMTAAIGAGVAESRIWLDPGIGFGKTVAHNLELIDRLGELRGLGRPVVLGASRKSFLGKLTGRDVEDRLAGSLAAAVMGVARGADVLRVHDVAATRDAALVARSVLARGIVAGEPAAG